MIVIPSANGSTKFLGSAPVKASSIALNAEFNFALKSLFFYFFISILGLNFPKAAIGILTASTNPRVFASCGVM